MNESAIMSWYVYAMWVYRIERPPPARPDRPAKNRHINIPFASHYSGFGKYLQRLSSEMRVPQIQGFTMPTSGRDSETAAYFKQLMTRPFAVHPGDNVDQMHHQAFSVFCKRFEGPLPDLGPGIRARPDWPTHGFNLNWLKFAQEQDMLATEGQGLLLDRYELPGLPSIWDSKEVQSELEGMLFGCRDALPDADGLSEGSQTIEDHDAQKSRAQVKHCVAIIG